MALGMALGMATAARAEQGQGCPLVLHATRVQRPHASTGGLGGGARVPPHKEMVA